MKTRIFLVGLMFFLSVGVRGQITILGKDSRDKVLSGFFTASGSNTNAAAIVQGLNGNHGTNRWNDALIPLELQGRTLIGTFTGTNRIILQVYDTNNAAFQTFEFTLNGGAPVSSNVVSRVGVSETNSFKILNNWRAQTNGVNQSGVLIAKGGDYGTAVAGKTGTNRVDIMHEYTWSAPTHYLIFTEGVLSVAQ